MGRISKWRCPLSQFSRNSLACSSAQSSTPARKLPLDDFEGVEADVSFELSIDCVKVRRGVIVIIHSDHDSEKNTESGYYDSILLNFLLRRAFRPRTLWHTTSPDDIFSLDPF